MSAQIRDSGQIRSLTLQGEGQAVGHLESSSQQAALPWEHSNHLSICLINTLIEDLCGRHQC